MTYFPGGDITTADYNTFATLANSMNEIYADLHPGAPSLPIAGYGYGQSPALTPVSSSDNITAAKWAALFDTMRKSGSHQGITTVPPLPALNPVADSTIISYAGLATLLSTLGTNRFSIAPGQSALTAVSEAQPSATPWLNSLTYTCSMTFASWDNARYFFNAGGYLSIAGTYSPVATPDDASWSSALTTMGIQKLLYNSSTGTNPAVGFYGLSTTPIVIYLGYAGGGMYYSGNTISISAHLNNAPGLATSIIFTIVLTDNDPSISKPVKNGSTTFTMSNLCAAGANVSVAPPTATAISFLSA